MVGGSLKQPLNAKSFSGNFPPCVWYILYINIYVQYELIVALYVNFLQFRSVPTKKAEKEPKIKIRISTKKVQLAPLLHVSIITIESVGIRHNYL